MTKKLAGLIISSLFSINVFAYDILLSVTTERKFGSRLEVHSSQTCIDDVPKEIPIFPDFKTDRVLKFDHTSSDCQSERRATVSYHLKIAHESVCYYTIAQDNNSRIISVEAKEVLGRDTNIKCLITYNQDEQSVAISVPEESKNA